MASVATAPWFDGSHGRLRIFQIFYERSCCKRSPPDGAIFRSAVLSRFSEWAETGAVCRRRMGAFDVTRRVFALFVFLFYKQEVLLTSSLNGPPQKNPLLPEFSGELCVPRTIERLLNAKYVV